MENIFLRAALSGEIVAPPILPKPSHKKVVETKDMANFMPKPQSTKVVKRRCKHKYTQIEDLMILKAVEARGRDWRAVLQFMMKHSEVFDKDAQTFYGSCEVTDKKMHERLRKRFSLLSDGKKK